MGKCDALVLNAVPAGVGQLQDRKQTVASSELAFMCATALLQQAADLGGRPRVNPKLARVGTALRNYGAGLKPDQLCAARAKAVVPPKRQLIRAALQVSVAAFHGMNRKRIADPPTASAGGFHLNGPRKKTSDLLAVIHEGEVNTEPAGVLAEVAVRFVSEVGFRHFVLRDGFNPLPRGSPASVAGRG